MPGHPQRHPHLVQAAVTDLLGPPRAALLTELGEPASSTELALRRGVTPSAVE
ncbi:hypothetical protein AB0J83_12085 [Actinoplanes sp. NPDC049596]|uniref:hypothetical protein n=1 Tax=unclassified Actinoplanes TaxID=2626549 RepID=UPI003442B8FB